MHKIAPLGFIYCVSYYWLNSSSPEVSRFWTREFDEDDFRYSFVSAIVPKSYMKDGVLYVKAQHINPEDIDKRAQGVFIFKVPKLIWMEKETPLLESALTVEPSKELANLSRELLGNLTL